MGSPYRTIAEVEPDPPPPPEPEIELDEAPPVAVPSRELTTIVDDGALVAWGLIASGLIIALAIIISGH